MDAQSPAAAGNAGGSTGPPAARPIPVALSTASVFPDRVPDAFEAAARLGYDGVEIMVTADPVSQDAEILLRLADYHGVPVLAVHAPCLLITQRVWGREPWEKLVRAGQVAGRLGARVVVVHPPFRWQREYAAGFAEGLSRMNQETDVKFTVENMYPLRARGAEVAAYAPHWDPLEIDVPHVTLDLSHTAVSGSDAIAMAAQLGERLAHVHLADGTSPGLPDEHLVPGRGSQPCAELLHRLPDGYPGVVVLEVNTRRALSPDERNADLAESLAFARRHLAVRAGGPSPDLVATAAVPGNAVPAVAGPAAGQAGAPAGPGAMPQGAGSPDRR
jgi:sugar phosphate isomerase/epimerase